MWAKSWHLRARLLLLWGRAYLSWHLCMKIAHCLLLFTGVEVTAMVLVVVDQYSCCGTVSHRQESNMTGLTSSNISHILLSNWAKGRLWNNQSYSDGPFISMKTCSEKEDMWEACSHWHIMNLWTPWSTQVAAANLYYLAQPACWSWADGMFSYSRCSGL